VLGYAIGTVSGSAYNVALDVLGPRHPASRAILAAVSDVSPALLALVDYMAGVVLAEVTRRPPVDTGASARLETRRPRQYLTPTARRLPALLSAWVVTATVAGMLAGRSLDWRPPLIAAVVPGAIALIQHHIVRRPQRVITADALALDDTLRSSAAHALSGSASALLLVWAMEVTRRALIGDAGVPGTGWLLAATVATVGAYGLWSHYGSAHRGRRPERPDMAGTAEALGS
jgi:hypothetical protein